MVDRKDIAFCLIYDVLLGLDACIEKLMAGYLNVWIKHHGNSINLPFVTEERDWCKINSDTEIKNIKSDFIFIKKS